MLELATAVGVDNRHHGVAALRSEIEVNRAKALAALAALGAAGKPT